MPQPSTHKLIENDEKRIRARCKLRWKENWNLIFSLFTPCIENCRQTKFRRPLHLDFGTANDLRIPFLPYHVVDVHSKTSKELKPPKVMRRHRMSRIRSPFTRRFGSGDQRPF
ncbi:hypothetical protein TNCT_205111 [Trichonephila clavata]|uniref:Uncharacterized protein n=1 Tax=Trichonephila clavata TaxID=2740835 RepID=A0A8X6L5L1_TRICU|nr:hypothetical protein TNCT_205111 [Trichonephila clavata]